MRLGNRDATGRRSRAAHRMRCVRCAIAQLRRSEEEREETGRQRRGREREKRKRKKVCLSRSFPLSLPHSLSLSALLCHLYIISPSICTSLLGGDAQRYERRAHNDAFSLSLLPFFFLIALTVFSSSPSFDNALLPLLWCLAPASLPPLGIVCTCHPIVSCFCLFRGTRSLTYPSLSLSLSLALSYRCHCGHSASLSRCWLFRSLSLPLSLFLRRDLPDPSLLVSSLSLSPSLFRFVWPSPAPLLRGHVLGV